MRLFHGGMPGLRSGDLIHPGGSRPVHEGCVWCAENAAGRAAPGSPLTGRTDRVYLTPNRLYAAHYASLWGRGDLYQVEPIGDLERSTEDTIETYTTPLAVALVAVDRAVLLTWTQRRRLYKEWGAADDARLSELLRHVGGEG